MTKMNLWCFRKIFTIFISIFLFPALSADFLEVKVFKSEQANAIGLKIRDRALFVDIGGAIEGALLDEMLNFVRDTTHNTLIVTHQHADHFDLMPDVFHRKRIDKLIVAGTEARRIFSSVIESATMDVVPTFVDVSMSSAGQLENLLNGVLPGVIVTCLLPATSVGTDAKLSCNELERTMLLLNTLPMKVSHY